MHIPYYVPNTVQIKYWNEINFNFHFIVSRDFNVTVFSKHFPTINILMKFNTEQKLCCLVLHRNKSTIIFRNGRRVHRFILCQNYMMFLLVLNPPPSILRLNIAYLAVAEGWLFGWFVLFLQWSIAKNVDIVFLFNIVNVDIVFLFNIVMHDPTIYLISPTHVVYRLSVSIWI